MLGIRVKENPGNGFTVVYCHYSADPFKDGEWVEQEKKNYPNPNDWKRLYEIEACGKEGTAIHPMFVRGKHVTRLHHNPLKPMFRSWDFGVEVSVCKVYQIDVFGRILTLAEFVRGRVDSFKRFTSEAMDWCDKHFEKYEDKHGKIYAMEWQDFGDFAGTYQSDGKGQVYVEILADFGISMLTTPFSKTTKDRAIELINQYLVEEVVIKENEDGSVVKSPKFLIDESCTKTIDAYAGGYVYDKKERPLGPNHPYEDVCDPDHYFVVNKLTLIKPREYNSSPEDNRINPISGYLA